MQWLSQELKQEIKRVFEPRYKRRLPDKDVIRIAENLTEVMEIYLKMKLREKYGTKNA